MARQTKSVGPSLLHILENSTSQHLKRYLEQGDQNFAKVAAFARDIEINDKIDFREQVKSAVSTLSGEDMEPIETESQRVLLLCDGRGPDSCPPVLQRHLNNEDYEEWERQPDDLSRALWLHVRHRRAFDDAVAFRNAREWRDAEKYFSALEVPFDGDGTFHGEDVPKEVLMEAIQAKLGLSQRCGVSIIDLPKNKDHPAAVMLIVRHAGQLSSVAEHPEDGGRRLHYYLPQDEVVLIYTPTTQRIEVCGRTAQVRNAVSDTFAKTALKHDVSTKPLMWANYDTSRFLESLRLDAPHVPGFMIERTAVTEIELRLGQWERRVRLRVPFREDMAKFAEDSIGMKRGLRRALGISRVSIGVKLIRDGNAAAELLEFTISDRNRCTLSGLRDRNLRQLGRDLLAYWEIVQPFRDLEEQEVSALLPFLAEMFDAGHDVVSALFLEERGAPVRRLEEAGLLVRRGAEPVLLEDIDADMDEPKLETRVIYGVKQPWLRERLITALHCHLDERASISIDKDLTRIGTARLDSQDVSCYLCSGLNETAHYIKLDHKLRANADLTPGIVFVGQDPGWQYLGPHVIVPIFKQGDRQGQFQALNRVEIESVFRGGQSAALGVQKVSIEELPGGRLVLSIPCQPPLPIDGEHQKRCVRLLVEAAQRGQSGVETATLINGTGSQSVGQLFGARWAAINGKYIRNVHRKLWSLNVG